MSQQSLLPMWASAIVTAIVCGLLLRIGGLTLLLGATDVKFASFQLIALVLYLRRDRMASPSLRILIDGAAGIATLTALAAAGATASYLVAQHSRGWSDTTLAVWDQRLGFDWIALYVWQAQHPLVTGLFRAAYAAIDWLPIFTIVALAVTDRRDHLCRFMVAFGLTLGITIVSFAMFPAVSAVAYHLGQHPAYMPSTGTFSGETIAALRAGTHRPVHIGNMIGLIAFPSFHAVSAILFIYGSWPVISVRVPLAVICIAMLAATPIEGAHYLVDVLSGILLAGAAILVVERRGFTVRTPATALPQAGVAVGY